MNLLHTPFPATPVSRPSATAVAVRTLLLGGLLSSAPALWADGELPIPSATNFVTSGVVHDPVTVGNAMTVHQVSDKAVLNWQSFNIGAQNSVKFDQPSSTSVALNNIHQADPSRIFGSLSANGQIYLVNQSGFIFGKDSQVNANAVVATTLDVSQDAVKNGLAQTFDLTKGAALSANGIQSKDVQIIIEKGANISTTGSGGRIIMAAPTIVNSGTIQSKDGQVILAGARDKVYLQPAASDSGVRGLLVEVGTGGEVKNLGKVIAERGNASLIGFLVNQQGQVSTTTSVNLNGSVRLLAREGIQNPSATSGKLLPGSTTRTTDLGDGLGLKSKVMLGKSDSGQDSLTSVELDDDKTTTAVDAQEQPKSRIEIMGHTVVAGAGSTVRAKSGQVTVTATDDPKNPAVKGTARIFLDKNSRIDVSGVKTVVLPMQRNVLEAELRKNELRDSPLQKDGILYGAKVYVDIRDIDANGRIPIADLSGALARVPRNIDERSTAAGSIDLSSSGDLIAKAGSVLDVSGGAVTYLDGYIQTTQLQSGSQTYDIASADPNRHFDRLLGGPGNLLGLGLGHFEKGYVQGMNAGKVHIAAFNAMLDGIISGKTISGLHQRLPGDRAAGSELSIDLTGGSAAGNQSVSFAKHTAVDVGVDDAFPAQSGATSPLQIDPGLFKSSGLAKVTLQTNGDVTIGSGTRVNMVGGGSLSLSASGFDVQGKIVAPSGDVSLQASPYGTGTHITLGSKAAIDVAGRWYNDRLDGGGSGLFVNGGSVSLASEQGDLRLEKGSQIDASGGAWLSSAGTVRAGHGGAISLSATTTRAGGAPSSLILEGNLKAGGLLQGGSLSLRSNEVVIGDGTAVAGHADTGEQALVLSESFFQKGGFADFDIGSNKYGLTVTDGTQVNLKQLNYVLPEGYGQLASGARLSDVSRLTALPDYERGSSTLKLSVDQQLGHSFDAVLSVGKGARLSTEGGGSLDLVSDTSIHVDGTLEAPGGHIGLTLETPRVETGFEASQSIWLGKDSQLLARGVFEQSLNTLGLKQGEVLDGGSVEVTAKRGYIVTEAGSLIDVSGGRERLQFADSQTGGGGLQIGARDVYSAGGTVSLKAGEGMLLDGGVKAASGGGTASGGTLSIELDGGLRSKPGDAGVGNAFPDDTHPDQARHIVVSADSKSVIPSVLNFGESITDSDFSGKVLVSAAQLNQAALGNLQLKTDAVSSQSQYVGSIDFQGDVSLKTDRSIRLDTPQLNGIDQGHVTLDSPYVALGSSKSRIDIQNATTGGFDTTVAPDAAGGSAQMDVHAQNIDLIGGMSLGNFGQVKLESEGDIRAIGIAGVPAAKNYLGALHFGGDLLLKGDQVYPSTLSNFELRATGGGHQVLTVQGTGEDRGPVYSAGGRLSLAAPEIQQMGVLVAPTGSLSLNATEKLTLGPGSTTSVSADGLTTLFGRGSAGNWLYPVNQAGSLNLVIDQPPEKQVSLSAPELNLEQGATVDLSGGGDLYAYEFIPGMGGSHDVLDANDASFTQKYAVIPTVTGGLTPYDPLEFPSSGLHMGDSVYLSGGAGLKAGWYTLLPAHYALLPGAFLVTPEAGTRDMTAGTNYQRVDGATVVSGRYGVSGTSIADSRWQGFTVEKGDVARTRSEYKDYYANDFFTIKAGQNGTAVPSLPMDAGSLVLDATASIRLDADLKTDKPAKGRSGQVDIDGDRITLVATDDDIAKVGQGVVGIVADDLNRLNAPSLLVGGQRHRDAQGVNVAVGASEVTLGQGAHLKGNEIILAARDELRVSSGAVVESTGKVDSAGETLRVSNAGLSDSDGALLRVSSAGQADVVRTNATPGNTGVLAVEQGAQLKAEGSMVLDSTRNTQFDGDIVMNGGALALSASRISIGNAPAGTAGLVLANADFTLDELKLSSASTLDLYGGLDIATKNLVIDSAGINGLSNSGSTSTIQADRIELTNTRSAAGVAGTGDGALELKAKTIDVGSGQSAIQGYASVTLDASAGGLRGLAGAQPGSLRIDGDVKLSAGSISGEAGSTASLDATGHRLTLAGGTPSTTPAGLGASWSLTADAIGPAPDAGQGPVFDLPSGVLNLKANQEDLVLGPKTQINVGGTKETFGNLVRYGNAGSVNLQAAHGNVVLDAAAKIDLSGANAGKAEGGNGGALSVAAPEGQFDWQGSVTAKGADGARQGSLSLDVASLPKHDFSTFNGQAKSAGFTESLSVRQRQGDLTVALGDQVQAHNIQLQIDNGKATIAGQLDASGAAGGDVRVIARNGIDLSGKILAKATDSSKTGGSVLLDTVHRDDAGGGMLDLSDTRGVIDVSGGDGGVIHLRTSRDADGKIAVMAIGTQLIGFDAQRSALEANRVYQVDNAVVSDAINQWKADTADFMASAGSLQMAPGLSLVPGLEIRSAGDLTLAERWDFMEGGWRYGDSPESQTLPGYLTLRAGGDLNIDASLTDAFANTGLPGADPTFRFQDVLQTGRSWSYTLVAGRDVKLAPKYSAPDPKSPTGSLTKTQVVVRTGTGSIDVQAGGDIRFVKDALDAKAAAAVYTAGTPKTYTFADLKAGLIPGLPARNNGEALADYLVRIDPALANEYLRYGYLDVTRVGSFLAEYPTGGGAVNLSAGGNIAGIQTGQLVSEWLVRSGAWSDLASDTTRQSTAWGIDVTGNFKLTNAGRDAAGNTVFDKGNRYFNQNVGALGGGNVSIKAGGNIENLSAMLPTTGKPLGIVNDNGRFQANGTQINGGGDLTVSAGGDIKGGEFFVGRGEGRIEAGGSVAQGSNKLGTVLQLGDGRIDVQARQDLRLGTVFNPTITRQTDIPRTTRDTYLFTYGQDSVVSLGSAGGNVVLDNDVRTYKSSHGLSNNTGTGFEFAVYPSIFKAVAWSGDVRLNNAMTLFPSSQGQLELLAGQSVTSDVTRAFAVNVSDTDPATLPGQSNPASELEGSVPDKRYRAKERLDPFTADATLIHAANPLHAGTGIESYVVANTGDIRFSATAPTSWFMPTASQFQAGRDIRNLTLYGQNLAADDVTLIRAGRDIVYDAPLDNNGNVLSLRDAKVELGGPGHLQIVAGRNINLGSAAGVLTVGATRNTALPGDTGAAVELLAGQSADMDISGFLDKYGSNPDYADLLSGLAGKSREEQTPIVLKVMFEEIKKSAGAAAAASNDQRAALYKQGFDAINTLFPKGKFSGDLAMVFSQIKTLAGGGITLAVPGGKVDVGLAGKNGGLSKKADQLGIVVQQSGDLNAMTLKDFNVNQSRVFTLGGGNIAVWSSEGNIDAGKGAQAAISAPPPITTVDSGGNIVTVFPPIVSGSGIQAITPASDSSGGYVYLAAPGGYIDAGEAGIKCTKCFLTGDQVLNSQFVVSTSGTVGVPTAVAPPVMPTGADSAAAGAAKSAQSDDSEGSGKNKDRGEGQRTASISILSADVIGYGQCSAAEVREGKPGCGG